MLGSLAQNHMILRKQHILNLSMKFEASLDKMSTPAAAFHYYVLCYAQTKID